MSYKQMISNDSFFWFLYSDRFFHSAQKLEEVVRKAGKIWKEEMEKVNAEPGVRTKFTPTELFNNAERDRECHHVYPYLYYHSLELMFKGLAQAFSVTFSKRDHSLNKMFNKISEYIKPLPFDKEEIEKMLIQLDGIYWAQRYPYPNIDNNDLFDKKTEHLTINYEGTEYRSNNIGAIFDQHRETFMQLREHILWHENVKKILPKPVHIDI